jgi:hypothetical protein
MSENRVPLHHAIYHCQYSIIIKVRVNNLCYQQTVKQISLIHTDRRLHQHVSAIAFSHLQEVLVYKRYEWN